MDKDVPMIPKHQAETDKMHLSWAVKCIMTVSITALLTVAVCVYIFVNGYTSRTKDWLNTFNNLLQNSAVTEVADDIQQYAPP